MASDATVLGAALVAGGLAGYVAGWAGMVVLGTVVILVAALQGAPEAPETRNCPDCGAPNSPDATTCDHCGASLSDGGAD
jgi:hypothetical protein